MIKIKRVLESLEEVPINSQMIKGYIIRMNNYARNHNAKVLYTKDKITVVPLFDQHNTDQIELTNGIDKDTVSQVTKMIDRLTSGASNDLSMDNDNIAFDEGFDSGDMSLDDTTDDDISFDDVEEDNSFEEEEPTDDSSSNAMLSEEENDMIDQSLDTETTEEDIIDDVDEDLDDYE